MNWTNNTDVEVNGFKVGDRVRTKTERAIETTIVRVCEGSNLVELKTRQTYATWNLEKVS